MNQQSKMNQKQDQNIAINLKYSRTRSHQKPKILSVKIDMQKSSYAIDSQQLQAEQSIQNQDSQENNNNHIAQLNQRRQSIIQSEQKSRRLSQNEQKINCENFRESLQQKDNSSKNSLQQEQQCLQFASQDGQQQHHQQQKEQQYGKPLFHSQKKEQENVRMCKDEQQRVEQEVLNQQNHQLQNGQSRQRQNTLKQIYESEQQFDVKELTSKAQIQSSINLAQSVVLNRDKQIKQPNKQQYEVQVRESSDSSNESATLKKSQQSINQFEYNKKKFQQFKQQKEKLKFGEQFKYPSLDQYPQKLEQSRKLLSRDQEKPNNKVKDNKKEQRPLVQYHQSEQLCQPQFLSGFGDHNTTTLKFLNYSVQYFLKIQTQIFTIEVIPPANQQNNEIYRIKRRFSDFVFLYDAITTNHLGFILYPFPQKTIESFIKLKLNIHRQQGQKIQLIEKRMSQLEKFMNFILQHSQLRFSEEIIIFIKHDQDFQIQRKRIQSYVQQLKQLEKGSNIKNIVDKGIGFISSYLSKPGNQKKSLIIEDRQIQFSDYLQKVESLIENLNDLLQAFTKLEHVEKENSQYSDIETDVDALLKLCAKHSSAKEFNRYLQNWISNEMIQFLQFRFKHLKQVEQQLAYRNKLVQLTRQLSMKGQLRDRFEKLQRRVMKFDRNFSSGWDQTIREVEDQLKQHSLRFWKVWRQHQMKMIKIWHMK